VPPGRGRLEVVVTPLEYRGPDDRVNETGGGDRFVREVGGRSGQSGAGLTFRLVRGR
jgi:hypothetical protein